MEHGQAGRCACVLTSLIGFLEAYVRDLICDDMYTNLCSLQIRNI